MCAATTEPMDTGLSEKLRAHFELQLSGVLDDAYSLMVQTHVYHWNVRGPLFEPIHKLLQQHYETLFETADEIAERVRQLGFAAPVGARAILRPGRGWTAPAVTQIPVSTQGDA